MKYLAHEISENDLVNIKGSNKRYLVIGVHAPEIRILDTKSGVTFSVNIDDVSNVHVAIISNMEDKEA